MKVKQISNPLTIIGVFAGITEVAMVSALGLLNVELHSTFIWFIMFFPVLLVSLFFWTLNKNSKVLYSPSDFKDENVYLQTMGISLNPQSDEEENDEKTEIVRGKTFMNETIVIDGKEFNGCIFHNCHMIFKAFVCQNKLDSLPTSM